MKAVNAQGNSTSAGGANMTKSNMTNATSGHETLPDSC
jgi:hypothetical protein